jgi:ribonuclease D
LPDELRRLLSTAPPLKVGVALARDVQELRDLREFTPAGFLDLGDAARSAGLHNHGLRGLSAVLLGRRISKGAQRSNWAADELSEKQIRYAATDAWIGLRLYRELKNRGIV